MDCISLVADSVYGENELKNRQLKDFSSCSSSADVIPADELHSGGDFHMAATFSHLIREKKG